MQFRHRSESKMDERSYSCEPTGGRDNPSLMEQFKGAVGSFQQHLMEQHTGGSSLSSASIPPPPKKKTYIHTLRGQCILFSVVFTLSPPSHHVGSVWFLPVISLLLRVPNTVSPGRGLPIHMREERFQEDDRAPLSI